MGELVVALKMDSMSEQKKKGSFPGRDEGVQGKEEGPEEKLLEKDVAMKSMTRFVVDPEEEVIHLKTKKSLFIKTNGDFSFSRPTTAICGRITKSILKIISLAYLVTPSKAKRSVLKYWRRNISKLVWFISELRRNYKWRSEIL